MPSGRAPSIQTCSAGVALRGLYERQLAEQERRPHAPEIIGVALARGAPSYKLYPTNESVKYELPT
jgi:hypothetical protein